MSSPKRSKRGYKYTGPKTYEATDGLDDFLRVLEKYFFATAKVKCKHDSLNNRTDLIIDLYHNFGITECLRHFNNGDWGGNNVTEESHSDISSSLNKALQVLNQKSAYPTDIMELSMHFKDTSIIISRLYRHSIPEHASNILTLVGKHFVYFTKGLTEMPYEVFVPIFEDTSLQGHRSKINVETNYNNYWGLYFDKGNQEHEALIYSLQQKKFYEESIFLFE
ncbi:hypothetical protein GUA46_08710 [Muricauda sp. HICW]|uniref:Uncharacterized protein n=1 Tax=Flagellimonas chongwuensis TaxID=2697365 RepID=A0A850NHK4_9FLAO|nr:hypothetical protein [Allomuricauda chongwuensis]NVN18420.1 hypothetical protein [Allomuricauda chongwuensis]